MGKHTPTVAFKRVDAKRPRRIFWEYEIQLEPNMSIVGTISPKGRHWYNECNFFITDQRIAEVCRRVHSALLTEYHTPGQSPEFYSALFILLGFFQS